MRIHHDVVQVALGQVPEFGGPVDGPVNFRWRGRCWHVLAVQDRWIESKPWWDGPHAQAVRGLTVAPESLLEQVLSDRSTWRVQVRSDTDSIQFFELIHDQATQQWMVSGVWD